MGALLLTVAIFAAFWLIGLAVLSGVRADLAQLRIVLTAPVVGSVTAALVFFLLSYGGVTMGSAGRPAAIALLVLSAVVVAFRRPRIRAAVLAVLAVCVVNLALLGRPMLKFDFNWYANANADMAAYVLSATQLLDHGLIAPEVQSWIDTSSNYSGSSQPAHNSGARPGADIAIAGLSAATGVRPANIFMPLIIALNLGTICAAAALAMQAARRWWAAPVAAGLLSLAPLAGFGVLQQLLPQAWGLGIAAALFAWLMREEVHRKPGPARQDIVVISLLTTMFLVIYIELAASLAVAYALYVVILAFRRRLELRPTLILWGAALLAILLVHRRYLPHEITYVRGQASNGVAPGGGTTGRWAPLFGYTLVPTSLPGILGLQVLPANPAAKLLAVTIAIALVALVALFVYALVTARRGVAASTVVLADALIGFALFAKHSDFGLYKMYMYLQPFLAAMVAVWVSSIRRWQLLVLVGVLFALLAAVQVRNANTYVSRSRDPIDLHHASSRDFIPYFAKVFSSTHRPVVSITDNLTAGGLEAARIGHRQLFFISRAFWGEDPTWALRRFAFAEGDRVLHDRFRFNEKANRVIEGKRCLVLVPTGDQTIVNRFQMPEHSGRDIDVQHCGHFRQNTLLFINSRLGQAFYLPADRRRVSIYQLERDPLFPGTTVSGFGRYALFRVLNPSRTVRLLLDVTTTFNQGGSNALPPSAAVGARRAPFPIVGRGSARVVSAAFKPELINGTPFVLIDMGVPGRLPPHPRKGIAALYGTHVPIDGRYLTSWVRDVSLVTDRQLAALKPPASVDAFPHDLENVSLEYSGIYEDGWLSGRSWLRLAAGPATNLEIRASVPPTARPQHLVVRVGGKVVLSQSVSPGLLETTAFLSRSKMPRVVSLRWAQERQLGPHDKRPASARLLSIGYSRSFASLVRFPIEGGVAPANASGIDPDGWARRSATMVLAGGAAGRLAVNVEVTEPRRVWIAVDGRGVLSKNLKPGWVTLDAPVGASASPRRVVLRWSSTGRIGPNDARVRAALIRTVQIVPQPSPAAQSAASAAVAGSGLYADGWVGRDATVRVEAGAPAVLRLRGEVVVQGQQLTVAVNGQTVSSGPVPQGALALDLPIGPSPRARTVTLSWAKEARVGPNDAREASAHITRIAVDAVPTRQSVQVSDVDQPDVPAAGLYRDGWMRPDARFLLAGGGAAVLSVHALVLARDQTLAIVVNGREVTRTTVAPGDAVVDVPIGPSSFARLIELRWGEASRISARDSRSASALLRSVGLVTASPVSTITTKSVSSKLVATSGIYGDGWMQPDARMLMSGGPASWLTLTADVLAPGQSVAVIVNGRASSRQALPRGRARARVRVPASSGPRLVRLRFATARRISAADPRQAAARLLELTLGHPSVAKTVAPSSSPTLAANLSAEQEVPAPTGVPSSAAGTFVGTLTGSDLRWELRVSGLSGGVTATVIHEGTSGTVGPRLFPLCGPCRTATKGTVTVTAAQRSALLHGTTYVNVGTPTNPDGEIRGAITRAG